MMNIRWLFLASVVLLASLLGYSTFVAPQNEPEPPRIFGRLETGLVSEHCIPMKIRMDTGAQTSSISAKKIRLFTKDNEDWVSFTLDPEHSTISQQFELPLTRVVKIRNRTAEIQEDTFERRPVVLMPVTLGPRTEMIQVSLADRSHFNYGMLMGRTAMLQFGVAIDPSLIYTVKSTCQSENQVVH